MSAAVSAYQFVRTDLGLVPGSSSVADPELSWLFLLLSALEAADSGPTSWEVPNDAYSTVLRRLQPFSNCVAYRRLAQIVNGKIK